MDVSKGASMTMLDQMRRHMGWLKWSLGLVVLAFVIFYIPDFLRGSGADAASGDTIATVDGRDITAGEFRRTYQAQLQAYRNAYGGQRQRAAAEAARHRAADSAADGRSAGGARRGRPARHHARATRKFDSESSRRRRSRRTACSSASSATSSCCARSGRPMTAADFEDTVRQQLVVEKLRAVADRLAVDHRQGTRAGVPAVATTR